MSVLFSFEFFFERLLTQSNINNDNILNFNENFDFFKLRIEKSFF